MSRPVNRPFSLSWTTEEPLSQRIAAVLEILNGAGARLRALRVAHQEQLEEARNRYNNDPNLTAEGRQEALRERTQAVGVQSMRAFAAFKSEVETAHNTINTAVESAWPKPAAGVEAMLARQASWSRMRSLLEEKAVKPDQLVDETTDLEQLHALTEELPTYVRAKGLGSPEQIGYHLDLRMAQLASGPSTVDLAARYEANSLAAALEALYPHVESEFTGGATPAQGIAAAVAAAQHRHAVIAIRTGYERTNPQPQQQNHGGTTG